MTSISDQKPPAGAADYTLLLALSLIWGSSFLFIKLGVETIPPATLTASRLAVAAGVLVVIARLAGQSLPLDGRIWVLITAFCTVWQRPALHPDHLGRGNHRQRAGRNPDGGYAFVDRAAGTYLLPTTSRSRSANRSVSFLGSSAWSS